jgi:predicted nucleic acid-binding protein
MTKQLFFDTDCMSAFLWVKRESILFALFPGRIVLPKQVYDELCHPSLPPYFKRNINQYAQRKELSIKEILVGTEEYNLYYELAFSHSKGKAVLGKGEAVAVALAKVYNGIIASSNFKDVAIYAKKYKLEHIGAGDILVAAFKAGYIDEATGNNIWRNMIARKRRLPKATFTEYLIVKDTFICRSKADVSDKGTGPKYSQSE